MTVTNYYNNQNCEGIPVYNTTAPISQYNSSTGYALSVYSTCEAMNSGGSIKSYCSEQMPYAIHQLSYTTKRQVKLIFVLNDYLSISISLYEYF